MLRREMPRQCEHVFRTPPQRFQVQRKHAQPVVQVFTKSPIGNRLGQIHVARSDHPNVYRRGLAATNPFKADLSDRERHIVDFALKMTTDSAAVTDADLDTMRGHGFTDDEIWDIGAITAFFAMSNRLANLASIRPNDEFYAMAR